jgi:hypothetical protein
MDESNPLNPFAQHYLEIQALDPAHQQTVQPEPQQQSNFSLVGWPIVLIAAFIFASVGYIWYARKRSMQALVISLVGVLMISGISLGVNQVTSPQSTSIQADSAVTPTSVVVNKVSNNGFTISWQTNKETSGAVRLSTSNNMQELVTVYTDPTIGTHHQITISNLDPNRSYYAQVLSDSVWFDHNGSPITLSLKE